MGRARAVQAAASATTRRHRTPSEQLPASASERELLANIYERYSPDPFAFENFAARIWALAAGDAIGRWELTRRYRDGGRDALGTYLLGPDSDRIAIEFALEAKCYAAGNGVGVRDAARLISRIRHREFGVIVTTSFVATQAYQEIREDGHPIVSGRQRYRLDAPAERHRNEVQLDKWIESEVMVPE